MVALVDASAYQHAIDFAAVRRAGYFGVMLKATEGAHWIDPDFHRRAVEAARTAGLHVGAYHYAHPEANTPGAEATHFLSVVRGLPLTLRPMLDLEAGRPTEAYGHWARVFDVFLRSHRAPLPLFYSYGPYIEAMRLSRPIGAGLVIAAYSRNDGREHPVAAPPPWRHYVAHQFTSRGRVPGIAGPVDVWSARSPRPLLAHPGAHLGALAAATVGRLA